MIVLEGVSKSYSLPGGGRNHPVSDVWAVLPGKRNIGVLGRNGAGKSTLLRLIAGTEAPDRGKIARHCRISWPLGFSGGFNGSTSGRDGVRFIARAYGADVEETITFVEAFSELGKYMDAPFKSYSAGMKARLAFGVSMAIPFDTYLVDEVMSVGDAPFQERCRRAFEARSRHANIIMTSHDPNMLQDFCDMGLIVFGGKVWMFDTIGDAARAYDEVLCGRMTRERLSEYSGLLAAPRKG